MEVEHLSPKEELNSIKLIRGQRGGYGWEVKLVGINENIILKKLKLVDEELKKTYTELNQMEVKQNG